MVAIQNMKHDGFFRLWWNNIKKSFAELQVSLLPSLFVVQEPKDDGWRWWLADILLSGKLSSEKKKDVREEIREADSKLKVSILGIVNLINDVVSPVAIPGLSLFHVSRDIAELLEVEPESHAIKEDIPKFDEN